MSERKIGAAMIVGALIALPLLAWAAGNPGFAWELALGEATVCTLGAGVLGVFMVLEIGR